MAIGQCWLRAHDSRESAISAAWVRFRVLCLEKNFNKERGGECLKRIDREAIALRTGKTGLAASKRNDSYCTTIKVKVAARNDATATAILARARDANRPNRSLPHPIAYRFRIMSPVRNIYSTRSDAHGLCRTRMPCATVCPHFRTADLNVPTIIPVRRLSRITSKNLSMDWSVDH